MEHSNFSVVELGWVVSSVVTGSVGNAIGTTCSTGERYSESALSLSVCQSTAQGLGYRFIYYQSQACRPAGEWCHIYISCGTTRVPNTCGTNYQYIGNTCQAYSIIISKCFITG